MWLLRLWQPLGLKVLFLPIKWGDGEPFEPKLKMAVKFIDKLTKNGDKVAIVGVSAGASAALNLYMAESRKVSVVVFICGKIQGFKTTNPRYFIRNPAFKESLRLSEKLIEELQDTDKAKLLCLKAVHDGLVLSHDSTIDGTKIKTVPAIGHLLGIIYSLTAGAPFIARYIRSRT
ncbi:TPA: hypothetical protein DIS56_00640 [Candidatus Saccharibacteria bacterium]|nr:MAG: hypothetical protein A3F05_03045 [Candidatus Saccharibacteria bacterium RIFCSPHIGHO2_12_FULL_47_17]HCM51631.1 hypothetical protein [Candidatus Saccharibacteria bacterium]